MIKKFSVLIASIILMLGLFISNRVPVFDGLGQYEVYLGSYSMTDKIEKVDKNGFKFMLGVKGESLTIDIDEFNLSDFLSKMNAKIIFTEELFDVVCYYGYSPKIKYLESMNGKLINIHIAISQQHVKVGCPIIYGSF